MSLLIDATVGAFVVLGALKIRKSRVEAYRLFKKAMLIDIFLGQIFIFYTSPVLALAGLVVKITILETLNYMISQEIYREAKSK